MELHLAPLAEMAVQAAVQAAAEVPITLQIQ
jgi:hypothetical protein